MLSFGVWVGRSVWIVVHVPRDSERAAQERGDTHVCNSYLSFASSMWGTCPCTEIRNLQTVTALIQVVTEPSCPVLDYGCRQQRSRSNEIIMWCSRVGARHVPALMSLVSLGNLARNIYKPQRYFSTFYLNTMPKASKQKWYAVRHGREGSKIYDNWPEVRHPSSGSRAWSNGSLSLMQAEKNASERLTISNSGIWLGSRLHAFVVRFTSRSEVRPKRKNGSILVSWY